MKVASFVCSVLFVTCAQAQVTCDSTPAASCKTPEGMCFDFVASDYADPEIWENMCAGTEGEYSETRCNTTGHVLKCLTSNNVMMPITHYYAPFSLEEAQQICGVMGGSACK